MPASDAYFLTWINKLPSKLGTQCGFSATVMGSISFTKWNCEVGALPGLNVSGTTKAEGKTHEEDNVCDWCSPLSMSAPTSAADLAARPYTQAPPPVVAPIANGGQVSIWAERSGIGGNFALWTYRARASLPFSAH